MGHKISRIFTNSKEGKKGKKKKKKERRQSPKPSAKLKEKKNKKKKKRKSKRGLKRAPPDGSKSLFFLTEIVTKKKPKKTDFEAPTKEKEKEKDNG